MVDEPKGSRVTLPTVEKAGFEGVRALGFGGTTMLLTGLIVCLIPVVGLFIGIPLILIAVVMLVGAPLGYFGKRLIGPCPYCDHNLATTMDAIGIDCPACKQRVLIRNHKFFTLQ